MFISLKFDFQTPRTIITVFACVENEIFSISFGRKKPNNEQLEIRFRKENILWDFIKSRIAYKITVIRIWNFNWPQILEKLCLKIIVF